MCGRARALSRGGGGAARGGEGWGGWGAAVWPGGGVAHLGRDPRGLPLPPRPAAAGAVPGFNPAVQPRGSFRGMRLPRLFSWVNAALGTAGTAPFFPVL